jgi:conjugal transfer pilus assembly protein TraV
MRRISAAGPGMRPARALIPGSLPGGPAPGHPGRRTSATDAQVEAEDSRYRVLAELLEEPETPLLQPPKVLRVLLLPYRGEDNELFMTRYAFLEVERAQWVLTDE